MTVGKMFYRTARECWYVKVDGKMIRLSPDEEEAKTRYQAMLVEHGKASPTIADAIHLYLDWLTKNRAEATATKAKYCLDQLVRDHGEMKPGDLTPNLLLIWIDRVYTDVSDTTKHDRITLVQTCWNWLSRQRLLDTNLIASVPKPRPATREFFVEREKWPMLLTSCGKFSRPVIEFMLYTGARPQEALRLLCGDWDPAEKRFVLMPSRSKGKKFGRQIYVPDHNVQLVLDQIDGRKGGHVFRNSDNKPWTKDAINCAFRRLKKKLFMPHLCGYTLRHSFAADRVRTGVSLEIVAKLMGHRSTNMVYQRYGHLSAQNDPLRNAINL